MGVEKNRESNNSEGSLLFSRSVIAVLPSVEVPKLCALVIAEMKSKIVKTHSIFQCIFSPFILHANLSVQSRWESEGGKYTFLFIEYSGSRSREVDYKVEFVESLLKLSENSLFENVIVSSSSSSSSSGSSSQSNFSRRTMYLR